MDDHPEDSQAQLDFDQPPSSGPVLQLHADRSNHQAIFAIVDGDTELARIGLPVDMIGELQAQLASLTCMFVEDLRAALQGVVGYMDERIDDSEVVSDEQEPNA